MNTSATEASAPTLTRDEIRAQLIGTRHEAKRERVTLFGVEVDLRQPTLASILDAREEDDERTRTTDVFLNYAFVPGTDERVFEEGDRDAILNWPFTEELMEVQIVIARLTGIDLADAEEVLNTDPLDESS